MVRKVLVIAPLRVARDTWPAEIKKWDHLKGLSYSVAVGNEAERKAALYQRSFVYIINRENVQWLIEESGVPFDYDMVVIDELCVLRFVRHYLGGESRLEIAQVPSPVFGSITAQN